MELIVNFKWVFICLMATIAFYFLKDYFSIKLQVKKDIHFKDKDASITSDLISKFPLVSPDFIGKNTKEQNIENNQEIHELNKKIGLLEEAVRINSKNIMELKKNG